MFFKKIFLIFLPVVLGDCRLCGVDEDHIDSSACNYIAKTLEGKDGSFCDTVISKFGSQCCLSKRVTEPPKKINYIGPYKPCDICRGEGVPLKTSMVMNFLYLGVGTCPQYYEFGLQGRIPNHLCSPVQYYSGLSCECGTVKNDEF